MNIFRKFTIGVVLTLSVAVTAVVADPTSASAEFNAGNIISDTVFTAKDTMSPSQIQSFLNGKVSSCDTWGAQQSEFGGGTRRQWGEARGYNPPYTCLKDFSENGKSAAQIIYDVSQKYSINPQVMIVLLQKEQGLVTDTWPTSTQYRSATGYGCPDTAPCDSQYYGLTNQLDWAAKMFRAIVNNSPTWYTPYILGNNYIQYNPTASCGGSNVNIQNRSTQALYNYTPYQPNAAALAAPMGATVPCGAYGNLNFYRYFTNWFGSAEGVNPEERAVWRLWNPTSRSHLLSGSAPEVNEYLRNGWSNDGIVMRSDPKGNPVYRLWNGRTHFFTQSTVERDQYVRSGWSNDGEVFKAPTSGAPVWRLWNGRTHFFTSNAGEYADYVQNGWISDGIVYYVATTEEFAVHRLYNPRTNAHILLSNPIELTNYIANGWIYDGIAFRSDPNGAPVYRLWNGRTHFFTQSTVERDEYVRAGWKNDGEIFKAPTTGSPVYRLWNGRSHFFTRSITERNQYTQNGWTSDGIVFYTNNLVTVHRGYSTKSRSHMTATSMEAIWNKAKNGWVDDGQQFRVSLTDGVGVYQLYDSARDSYFYTKSASEANTYTQAGWRNDGIVFAEPNGANIPVYRLYSPSNQTHLLTSSGAEISAYVQAGWVNDGEVFKAK